MVFGYSSHGSWDVLKNIKKIELERDNEWFNDSSFDLENDVAMWVSMDPVRALMYKFSADFEQSIGNPGYRPPDFLLDEWNEFQEAIKNPSQHIIKVDLTGAVRVLGDGDKGFLYVKKSESRFSKYIVVNHPNLVRYEYGFTKVELVRRADDKWEVMTYNPDEPFNKRHTYKTLDSKGAAIAYADKKMGELFK
jgi:hypothetical protein